MTHDHRNPVNHNVKFGLGVALCIAINASAALGQQWTPPAPVNLKVLDSALDARELMTVMRGFTQALGVRCQHCHVFEGNDPNNLSRFDFANDDKREKRMARSMVKMAEAINRDFPRESSASPPDSAKVTCYTCHRGEKRPRTV
jgi:hypothetical protein